MNGLQALNGLQFDQQDILDEQIGNVFPNYHFVVPNSKLQLLINPKARSPQFLGQGIFVAFLKKPAPQFASDLVSTADDFLR